MSRALTLLIVAAAFVAAPAAALGQSAGDEQYTDPFGQEDPGGQQQEQAGQQQEPAPAPEQPPSSPAEPAPGGNGTAEAAPTEAAPTAEATQEGAATLPRTGGPVVLVAAIGYALLLAGIAIRRKA